VQREGHIRCRQGHIRYRQGHIRYRQGRIRCIQDHIRCRQLRIRQTGSYKVQTGSYQVQPWSQQVLVSCTDRVISVGLHRFRHIRCRQGHISADSVILGAVRVISGAARVVLGSQMSQRQHCLQLWEGFILTANRNNWESSVMLVWCACIMHVPSELILRATK
jgi:hypothetical protein